MKQHDAETARLTRWMNAGVQQSQPDKPRDGLRVSGLPYCPLLHLEGLAANEPGEWDFGSDHYTRIGSAIHELLQDWLPRLQADYEVWSNWRCSSCNRFVKDAPLPKACRCGGHWNYVEYDFSAFPGLDSAHCDLLLRHKRSKRWTVADFKTTGIRLFEEDWYARYYPEKKHLIQTENYAALFWFVLRRRISYYAIIYYSRERPYKINPKTGELNFYQQIYAYPYTQKIHALTLRRLRLAIAGRRALLAKPKALYDLRPCTSRLAYHQYMEKKFFGKEQCPYFANNVCFQPKAMQTQIEAWQRTVRRLAARGKVNVIRATAADDK